MLFWVLQAVPWRCWESDEAERIAVNELSLKTKFRGLNANALKLIAALTMLLDHVGLVLFPQVLWLRVVGRLAMPIYAFMIAEGCHHSRNRLRYFGMVFGLAAVCQLVYAVVLQDFYMCILVTFSLSILMIYALQFLKSRKTAFGKALAGAMFVGCVAGVWLLNRLLQIDYGFWGCMLPVFPAVLYGTGRDSKEGRLGMLALGLLLLSLQSGGIQILSLLAVPVLALYNGQRGKWRMKYFFYLFYPLHLAAIQGIAWLLALI